MNFKNFVPELLDFMFATNDNLVTLMVTVQRQLELSSLFTSSIAQLGKDAELLRMLVFTNLGITGFLILMMVYLLGKGSK